MSSHGANPKNFKRDNVVAIGLSHFSWLLTRKYVIILQWLRYCKHPNCPLTKFLITHLWLMTYKHFSCSSNIPHTHKSIELAVYWWVIKFSLVFITELIIVTDDSRLKVMMLPPQEEHDLSSTLPHLHMKVTECLGRELIPCNHVAVHFIHFKMMYLGLCFLCFRSKIIYCISMIPKQRN